MKNENTQAPIFTLTDEYTRTTNINPRFHSEFYKSEINSIKKQARIKGFMLLIAVVGLGATIATLPTSTPQKTIDQAVSEYNGGFSVEPDTSPVSTLEQLEQDLKDEMELNNELRRVK